MLTQRATTLTLESIDKFRSSLSARGRSDKTVRAYSTDLKMMLRDLSMTEVPMEEFEETAMNWLQGTRRQMAPKTTGRRLTSLRAFGKWAGWGTLLTEYSAPVPAKGQPHPLPEGIDGVRRLIAAATHEKHRTLIALCGFCGLRVAEALAVEPGDFNLTEMTLTVRGKGDVTRIVPVSTVAWEFLCLPVTRAWVGGGGPIVGLKDRFARRVITDLGVRAGLKRSISSHDLRATFATAVYDGCKDQRVVQELLGHANGSTTELYIGRTREQMASAVEL